MSQRNRHDRIGAPLLAATLALALTSTSTTTANGNDYLDRSDTITHGLGDAIETNKAIQTITRWPKASRQDRWLSDGERARTAIARYRANKVIAPRTLSGKVNGASAEAAPVPEVALPAGSTANAP